MKHIRLAIVALLAIISLSSEAQTARLFTSAEGLANSHIHDIFQDSKGFMWISTENGLSKFDGTKFSTFRHERQDTNSLASNIVRTVLEDSKGTFWVGTSAGLQVLDTEYCTFTKFNLEDWSIPDSDQHITAILEVTIGGSRKILASSSGHGLYVIEADSWRIDHDTQNAINKMLPSEFISKVFKDRKGRLWITTEKGGLDIIDTENMTKVSDIWEDGLKAEQHDTFNSFTEESSTGNIYIGTTNSGILVMDSSTGKIRKVRGKIEGKYSIYLNRNDGEFVISKRKDYKKDNADVLYYKQGFQRQTTEIDKRAACRYRPHDR